VFKTLLALMLSIDINHPDVMDFIKIKRDLTQVTGANISIKLNNEFMKAVENDSDYLLKFPCNTVENLTDKFKESLEYNKLYSFDNNTSFKKIHAKEYWDEIIKSAHGYAEPGIMFEDNHLDYSPDGVYPQYKGVTTNP
jgi:ribonucleoside-diphosphate reductase alpha chain